MDFSSLGDLVSSLSTTGAQWYKLVSAPTSTLVAPSTPPFAPQSQSSLYGQGLSAATSGGGLLLIAAIVVGVILIARK